MSDQIHDYRRLIALLLAAWATAFPDALNLGHRPTSMVWVGRNNRLSVVLSDDDFAICIKSNEGSGTQVVDQEPLTLASAYAMVGKFIELEA